MLNQNAKLQLAYNEKIKSIISILSKYQTITYDVFINFYLDLKRCIYFKCNPTNIEQLTKILLNINISTYDKDKIKYITEIKDELTNLEFNQSYTR